MKRLLGGFLFLFFSVFLINVSVLWAEDAIPNMPKDAQIPGRIEATGTHFELTNSEYLNTIIDSTTEVKLSLESIPQIVTMYVESAAGDLSTQITLSGFAPQTIYHKYEDDLHNHETFTTDSNGSYTYVQELSRPHMIFIQPRPSTKFIWDNATGGDCSSIGLWDSLTKTCTLTMDVCDTIQIDSDGLTLDGNGYTRSGGKGFFGIYLSYRTNVTIKNLRSTALTYGIYLYNSSHNVLSNNTLSSSYYGIYLRYSDSNIITNNITNYNSYGISIVDSNYNNLVDNITNSNERLGIGLSRAHNSSLTGNTTYGNRWSGGIYLTNSRDNNIINNVSNSNVFQGISLNYSDGNTVKDNIASSNQWDGILLNYSNNNTLTNNATSLHGYAGITLFDSSNNTLTNNTTSNNGNGVSIYYSSNNNKIYNNNFINNQSQAFINGNGSGSLFNLILPIGGNYWSNYDTPEEGCGNINSDTFCDSPYFLLGGQDNLPWTKQDGWKGGNDTISPTTTITFSGTSGNNGWYLSDVEATLTAIDNEGGSSVAKTDYSFDNVNWNIYTIPFAVGSEGTARIYYRSTDYAGNKEAAKFQEINIDKTSPSIVANVTPAPNANGWYNTDVLVHFVAYDSLSGIDTVTPDIMISAVGANQSVVGTAFDKAGNSASKVVAGINIDKSAPIISITSPVAGKYVQSEIVNIQFASSDDLSGVYKNTVYLDGQLYDPTKQIDLLNLSLGTHTLKVESANYAGLMATSEVTFEVIIDSNSMIDIVKRLYQMGAIYNEGIMTSLVQKLEAAQSNQNGTAINILNAFISALNPQQMSGVAIEILKTDATYVIGHL